MANATVTGEASARLCAACGMCCNGVMFHSVRLQPGDSARKLAALGLKLKSGKSHFPQPCPAHQESCCAIYAHRPARCRIFSCRQLDGVASGTITEAAARGKILEAASWVARVRELFHRAGDVREHKAFATRYAAIFTPPLDPSPPADCLRGELASAMDALEQLLAKDFRTAAAAAPGSEPDGRDPRCRTPVGLSVC